MNIEVLVGACIVLLALISLAACAFLFVQAGRQRYRMSAIEAQLGVFVDASINVARAMDRPCEPDSQTGIEQARLPTRRWLLREARQRLSNGVALTQVAAALGLCRDEVQLLQKRAGLN